jgi:Ca2+-binding EF-hand superfamily protein
MNATNPYLLSMSELISAKKKLGSIAAYYDPSVYSLKGFDTAALTPAEFREQLRQNLHINLTDAELGALVYFFDKDGTGMVNSSDFTKEFFSMGMQEKRKRALERKIEKEKMLRMEKKRQDIRDEKIAKLTTYRVATKWTPEQEESAIQKVAQTAFSYDFFKGGLNEFTNCQSVSPGEFGQLMRRNFSIALSPEEIAALFHIFGTDSEGKLDCTHFINNFFRLGRIERDRHRKITEVRARRQRKREEEAEDRIHEKMEKMMVAKLRPCTEEEEQSAFDKLRKAAVSFRDDVTSGGIIIRKCFEAESISPTIFRERMKDYFNVNLNPGELDAVVKIFDSNSDGGISCSEFLRAFFELGSEERLRRLHETNIRNQKRIKAMERRQQKALERNMRQTATGIIWPRLPDTEQPHPSWSVSVESSLTSLHSGSHRKLPLSPIKSSARSNTMSQDGETSVYSNTGQSMKSALTQSQSHNSSMLMSMINDSRMYCLQKMRKPSMREIMAPNKETAFLSKGSSIVNHFPKASHDIKEFIRQIDLEEEEVRKFGKEHYMRLRSRQKRESGNEIMGIPTSGSASRQKTPASRASRRESVTFLFSR